MENNWYQANNLCKLCGRPFIYVGDVPPGGFTKGFEPYCTCHDKSEFVSQPVTGWKCPVCGAGVSPFTNVCPCQQQPMTITCDSKGTS